MNNKDRRATATATFGLTGVGGAAALRHTALERAYKKGKRPPVLQELKMLKRGTKGRVMYAAGMGLGAVSAPAAVTGLNAKITGFGKKETKRKSFFQEGAAGMRSSVMESTNSVKKPPPARLALANYLGGGVVTAGAGALTNARLKKVKIPGAAKASIAAMAGVTAGASTLPMQSKVMTRISGNKYETTAHGVRRKKTRAVPASRMASHIDARPGNDSRAARAAIVPSSVAKMGEGLAAKFNTVMHGAADRMSATPRKGKLVSAGQSGVSATIRSMANNPSRMVNPSHGLMSQVGKAAYYGSDMNRAQKRSRVAAVTGLPVVSDIAQAGMAARMAPPPLRKQTAAQVYGGGQVGGTAGTMAGAYGAAALARRSKRFEAGTVKVNDALDSGKARIRSAVGLKPAKAKASMTERIAAHAKTPKLVKQAVKPLIGHGKVAAVGGLIAGSVGGVAGSQTGYGFALRAEDRYKAKVARSSQSARHGTRVVKSDTPTVMTPREQVKLRRAKHRNAVGSQLGGAIGLTALGATLGSKAKFLGTTATGHLAKVPVPLLTAGAGLSGANSFGYAAIQNKEASHKIKKGLIPGVRRAPRIARGSLRQTRTASTGAIRTSYTRGGIR